MSYRPNHAAETDYVNIMVDGVFYFQILNYFLGTALSCAAAVLTGVLDLRSGDRGSVGVSACLTLDESCLL